MTDATPSKYTFLPWIKTGLGALDSELKGTRAKISMKLDVRKFNQVNQLNSAIHEEVKKDFLLYGPGDIAGILKDTIIRTEPGQNELNVESNFFPHVEFSQPDFPWRYTPFRPLESEQEKLYPWLSLIVLTDEEFSKETNVDSGSLPVISVHDPVKSLPDLKQSWYCAHLQINQECKTLPDVIDILKSQSYLAVSRLICLRKLQRDKLYHAFLVPSFEAGRRVGLGEEITDENIIGSAFAWGTTDSPSEKPHKLPVYYEWQFTTSLQKGDFESLARRLERRVLSENVGLKKLDVSQPFLSFGKKIGEKIGIKKPLLFAGVLLSHNAKKSVKGKRIDVHNPSDEEIREFILKMKELLDLGERLSWSFVKTASPVEDEDPIISPPIYGKWHARKRLISKISENNKDPKWIASLNTDLSQEQLEKWLEKLRNDPPHPWLEELNLDPSNRSAAAVGTAVIQQLQEELMTSAWDQAGPLKEVNKRYRLSQLSRTISLDVYERCFKPMERDVFIKLATPLHSSVTLRDANNKNKLVSSLIQECPIPNAIFTPSFTKITAKRGKVHRSLFDKDAHILHGLLERMNKPSSNKDTAVATLSGPSGSPEGFLTIEQIVTAFLPPDKKVTEDHFKENVLEPNMDWVESIENSIPDSKSAVEEPHDVIDHAPLKDIKEGLMESLNPVLTIESKVSREVSRPERLHEETKDKLDPVVAYPEFKRPMFEPLRDLSVDLLLPGVKDIPPNTIGLLETNPTFINSYMVGLNHEMARELLWREYPTDQRGSYFRQFWDVSVAVLRESMASNTNLEDIVEKYRDIPEIHRWNNSALDKIGNTFQEERPVLLIKGELLRRYPGMLIYVTKAIGANEQISEPIFRGMIQPDITFFGFDLTIEELRGNNTQEHPGYFFVLQEQPSETRFGIDEGSSDRLITDPPLPPDSLNTWDDLNWDHVTLTSSGYADLESGPLVGKEITTAKWGSHAADLANILLQKSFRVAVHARELLPEE